MRVFPSEQPLLPAILKGAEASGSCFSEVAIRIDEINLLP